MAPDQDQRGPVSAATSVRDTVTAPAAPVMLDPLIRALDRAVARSAQAGPGCGDTALRD